MTIRLPNPRYIGDGVYARHDGEDLIIETSDGIAVQNRIALNPNGMSALQEYAHYANEFYRTQQHQVGPGCEKCGDELTEPRSPIAGAVKGEVYRVHHQEVQHEVRLCRECATDVSLENLIHLIKEREHQSETTPAA